MYDKYGENIFNLIMYYQIVLSPKLIFSLVEMLQDYERIQADIPAMILPMMKPYTDRVDEAMKPGLVALTWSSLNVDSCKSHASVF